MQVAVLVTLLGISSFAGAMESKPTPEKSDEVLTAFRKKYPTTLSNQKLLLQAVIENNRSVVAAAVSKLPNIDVNTQYRGGETLLHFAICRDPIITTLLINAGANVNIKNDIGETPLINAMCSEQIEIVKRLLTDKAIDVNAVDNDRNTPLYWAAYLGQKDIADLLIKKGANVNSKNLAGDTALHAAITNKHTDLVSSLLQAKELNVNIENNDTYTPLQLAVRERDRSSMQCLLTRGADVNASTFFGYTALHEAVNLKDKDGVKLLLEHGANLLPNKQGQTPIDLATSPEVKDVIHYYIKMHIKNWILICREKRIPKDLMYSVLIKISPPGALRKLFPNFPKSEEECEEERKAKNKREQEAKELLSLLKSLIWRNS